MTPNDVIIEFHQQGRYVKVSALDSRTLMEVSIVGDPAKGEHYLRQMVLQKLKFVLRRKKETAQPASGRGGIVV
ncbi:DUF6898 family protein [Rhodovibrionaceae bacterium A322]